MKRTILALLLIFAAFFLTEAREYQVYGPQGGKFFNACFDPGNPPEYIRCWGIKQLGREYLVETQKLQINETAAA